MGLDHALIHYKLKEDSYDYGKNEHLYLRKSYYFRKFYFLQEYMENIYQTQNCVTHSIMKDDIKNLLDIAEKWLETKDMSLLGNNSNLYNYEWLLEDMRTLKEYCTKILAEIGENDILQYWCWY